MNPASSYLHALPFLFQGVVNLVSIGYQYSREVLQEFVWMLGTPGLLVIEKDYGRAVLISRTAVDLFIA